MTLTWVPERAGNWLFHCHMLVHMMDVKAMHAHADNPAVASAPDPTAGMMGLVLGIRVTGAARPAAVPDTARRRIQMRIDPDTHLGTTPSYKVSIEGTRLPPPHLNEPTAIHWHGIELESYDDGVPGFGGVQGSVTPPVPPGGSFTARFTPPRAGTFIYHTHWHNAGQLSGGIYGPLIVLEPGQSLDSVTDHIVVLGLNGAYRERPDEPFAVNGQNRPRPMDLKAGVAHRFRFINITADGVTLTVQLTSRFDPVQWTLVSKDGADTPAEQRTGVPHIYAKSVDDADAKTWQWGKLHQSVPEHPLAEAVDGDLRAKLQPGPFPTAGSPYTPNQSSYRASDFRLTNGPSFRMVLDVGNWNNSRAINYPGQSGNPEDAHYRDLAQMWLSGDYFPLLYTRAEVEKATQQRIQLNPTTRRR